MKRKAATKTVSRKKPAKKTATKAAPKKTAPKKAASKKAAPKKATAKKATVKKPVAKKTPQTGPRTHETTVYIAAHQFYLQDAEADWSGNYTNEPWGDDGLGVAPGVVGIQSPRAAAHAPVFIEVLDAEPGEPDGAIQKVAVASIDLPSGLLRVVGEDNDESSPPLEVELAPGTWQVRVLFSGLDTVTYDDDDGAEHYVVQLSPGAARESKVVRAYEAVDDPVRDYVGTATLEQLKADLSAPDFSRRCRAIVDLARAGHTDLVADIVEGDPSKALRLAAANALRLVEAREALTPFAKAADKAIAGNVARALERFDAADAG